MINAHIFDQAEVLVERLADELLQLSQQAQVSHISLSGGSTPKRLFERLAKAPYNTQIDWNKLHFWWGDERCVSHSDGESNYGQAWQLLFSQVAIDKANLHPVDGDNAPELEAQSYAQQMQAEIALNAAGEPVFDWILLGVGDDGHTASLFPLQTDYSAHELALVAAHPQSGQLRVSKSARVLSAAKRITYLVLGEAKATVIAQINNNDDAAQVYPAAQIKAAQGITEWYLDTPAAKNILGESNEG